MLNQEVDGGSGVQLYSTTVVLARPFSSPIRSYSPPVVSLHAYLDKFKVQRGEADIICASPVLTDLKETDLDLSFGSAIFDETETYAQNPGFNLQFRLSGELIPFAEYGTRSAKLILQSHSPLWKVGEIEYNGSGAINPDDMFVQFKLYHQRVIAGELTNVYFTNTDLGYPLNWQLDPMDPTSLHQAFCNLGITILVDEPAREEDDEGPNCYGYGYGSV